MLELKNICFTREDKEILKNVDINFESGKLIAITGPNGSGKSTLVKVIMGITNPDVGSIWLNGQDISSKNITERANLGISFAFQQPVKFKGITVYDLIRFASRKNITKSEACDALSAVGLCAKEYVNREVNSSLSGGELKRIEIASVFVRKSEITILDEPEAGIDLWSFNNLISIFEDMKKKNNGTIIIISHQERILNIADKIILMNNGKVEKTGLFGDLVNNINVSTTCCKLGGNVNG